MSILDNRPALAKAVGQVAEVAGYLWQKGWAERNGGNITVNITEYIDDEIKAMPAISDVMQIGTTLPHLKGCYFYCKGTQMRMRDLARWPMDNGSIIRILDDCASYVIIADNPVKPTSELPSHLSVHNYLLAKGSPYRASLHTHPIELVALTHSQKYMEKEKTKQELASRLMKEACKKYKNVYFIQTNATDALHSTSVDGSHPNDYGYTLWAKSIEKPLLKILKKHGIK